MRIVRMAGPEAAPLVVHVIQRLAVGGLENGVVNLVNHMPAHRYRHAIVSLTDATAFRQRIQRSDVPVFTLGRRAGQDLAATVRLFGLLRRLRPDVVHTRNLPALECVAVAALAGVPARVHGEHGRDVYDLDGSSWKYRALRRVLAPLIHRFVVVSADLAGWLVRGVGVPAPRVRHIYNGVDTARFRPRSGARATIGPVGFLRDESFVIGTVGRMYAIKDQTTLVRAFLRLLEGSGSTETRLRLVVIGDGPLRDEARTLVQGAGAEGLCWLPGERSDVAEMIRALDLFVLPSRGEGISNTLLEAMATGLPVIATRVGGNPEVVEEGRTGTLVPPEDPEALAESIRAYAVDPVLARKHGQAGRRRAESRFSLEAMVTGYLELYDDVLRGSGRARWARSAELTPAGCGG